MKNTHTPGTWVASYSESNKSLASVTTLGRHPIAPCVGPNAEANARLIAAAPELLEALKLAIGPMADMNPEQFAPEASRWLTLARDAILKAEGGK